MNLSFLTQFFDASKVGGYARSGVAALLGIAIAKWPALSTVLDPATQAALGLAVSGAVVGIWSQLTKSDDAKLAAVEALPGVQHIVTNVSAGDGVAAAAADPTRPKVVSSASIDLMSAKAP
jgi:hypothetical protein